MLARKHNDANVCALGARVLAPEYALAILDTFLAQAFEGGRHAHRLAQIADIEEEEAKQGGLAGG
jgi:ribose 5-phosphate isomerase B